MQFAILDIWDMCNKLSLLTLQNPKGDIFQFLKIYKFSKLTPLYPSCHIAISNRLIHQVLIYLFDSKTSWLTRDFRYSL